eukprot:4283262-Pyramimonas_sp.AAC.1
MDTGAPAVVCGTTGKTRGWLWPNRKSPRLLLAQPEKPAVGRGPTGKACMATPCAQRPPGEGPGRGSPL